MIDLLIDRACMRVYAFSDVQLRSVDDYLQSLVIHDFQHLRWHLLSDSGIENSIVEVQDIFDFPEDLGKLLMLLYGTLNLVPIPLIWFVISIELD